MAAGGDGRRRQKNLAGESVSRIWISDLQMHNLRRINERFSFCDLWRQVFLTEVKTSDMFLTWCRRVLVTRPRVLYE
jgi:hypothetical protein